MPPTGGLGCAPTVNSGDGRVTDNRHIPMAGGVGSAMHTVYDTRTVHPLDRYEHFRAGTAAELVPVSIHGRSPGQLLAVMTVVQIGDFAVETVTWAADCEVVA